jgi:TonB family protein
VDQASEAPATSSPVTPSSEPVASRTDNKGTPAGGPSSHTDTESTSDTGKPAAAETDSTPVLVSFAGSGGGPFRLVAQETAVSASSSVAVSSQATILVPREVGADAAQEAKRLQLGALVFRVDPQYPKKIGRSEVEIVKLLATVGENGQVTNVQQLSGSLPFATAAISAIREWKYSPTLFDGRPVKTEQKITVAFRSR